MRVDLRYAALNQDTERRVRLAASALAAHQIKAAASEWDGTRCDFVIADASDGYGKHVMEIARRRGLRIFAFGGSGSDGEGVTWLSAQTNVAALATVLRDALGARRSVNGQAAEPPALIDPPHWVNADNTASMSAATSSAGLVRLATEAGLLHADLEATVGGRTVQLAPSSGRVFAASLSDLLGARERLADDGWEFTPLHGRPTLSGEVSASLDVFYLYGATRARAALPAMPAHRYGLRDWPDLGSAPDLTDALRVVQVLQRGNVLPSEIAKLLRLPEKEVSACLWAFSAAGLLTQKSGEPSSQLPALPTPKPPSGLIGRLAAHFGLSLR